MDFSPYAGSNLLLQFSLPVFRPLVSGTRLPGGLEAVALATKFGQYRQGDRPRRRARRREIKLGRQWPFPVARRLTANGPQYRAWHRPMPSRVARLTLPIGAPATT
jgi:hypothetical protein